MEKGAGKR